MRHNLVPKARQFLTIYVRVSLANTKALARELNAEGTYTSHQTTQYMKGTLMMLTFLGTLAATWLTLSLFAYLLSDNASFREISSSGGIAVFMLVFGWIPSIIVCIDVEEKLN
jgi:hypothetical protein